MSFDVVRYLIEGLPSGHFVLRSIGNPERGLGRRSLPSEPNAGRVVVAGRIALGILADFHRYCLLPVPDPDCEIYRLCSLPSG